MFHMSHPAPPVNGGLARGPGMSDGSGTINPAALSSSMSVSPNRPAASGTLPSPRGVKRSRSPEFKYDAGSDRQEDDGPAPRKRGRPPKTVKVSDGPAPQPPPSTVQTPQPAQHAAQLSPSQASPSQASPSKTTPTKAIKALPTVRDHTSMELNEEGDEYIPRELDPEGEKKVAPNGALLGHRQYRCRTFFMPNRGDRLFMLATECAKVLQYRDSYLLFNKNRSLYKIIANQEEKNDLIQQDILPSSYRSRQIAIVTARSMYRQFGSRLIVNGRRVRDDYFESRARKQGFTEDDLAGEKRPGMAKAREAAAAAATHADAFTHMPPSHVVYDPISQEGPQMGSTLANDYTVNNINMDDFSSVPRPRHDISGVAYHDRITPSNPGELLSHAAQTAEFNSNISQQRRARGNILEEMWRRPHEPPPAVQPPEGDIAVSSQTRQSPHVASSGPVMGTPQNLQGHASQQHAMLPPQYSPQSLHHNMISQTGRPSPQQITGSQMHHRQPGVPMGPGGYPTYGYGPQGQVWASAAPAQPSPLAQTPMQYSGHPVQQPSPHMGGHQGLHPQMGGQIQNMATYGSGNPAYGNVAGRQMYGGNAPSSQQQHFMPGHQPGAAGTQAGHIQAWPATTQAAGSQQWQGF